MWGGLDESEAVALNVEIRDTTAENQRSSLGVVLTGLAVQAHLATVGLKYERRQHDGGFHTQVGKGYLF